MPVNRIDAVLLRSPQIEAMAAFYRDQLGLPLKKEDHGPEPVHWGCFLAGVHFAIHSAPGSSPSPTTELSFEAEDVDATLNELRAAGVPVLKEPHDRPFGRLAAVQDPDGNLVYLHSYPKE